MTKAMEATISRLSILVALIANSSFCSCNAFRTLAPIPNLAVLQQRWRQKQHHQCQTKDKNTRGRLYTNECDICDDIIDMDNEEEDLAITQRTGQLCDERNIKFDNIKNARDLCSVHDSPIKPGRLYRMGRVSDASERDIEKLYGEKQIKTLVDLRSPTELKDDETLEREDVFGNFTNIVWIERGNRIRELKKDQPILRKRRDWLNSAKKFVSDFPTDEHHDEEITFQGVDESDEDHVADMATAKSVDTTNRNERHFVSLMNQWKYVKGTVPELRKRDISRTILKGPLAIFSKRIRNNIQKPFLDKINDGGLSMLNKLLLQHGAPGIKYVLELMSDETRHPVAFYCTAGKDRTGMIAAIVLGICDVDEYDIIEDYSLSANVYAEMNDHKAMVGALSQRNLDPKTFLCAPPSAMRDTLAVINDKYGSIDGYCDYIGFTKEQREKLRSTLLSES